MRECMRFPNLASSFASSPIHTTCNFYFFFKKEKDNKENNKNYKHKIFIF